MGSVNFAHILAVFLGAGLGGSCRYMLGVFVTQPAWLGFAGATLLANLLGAFAAGILFSSVGPAALKANAMGLFLMTGFLGGLTTFSAFTAEGAMLLVDKPMTTLAQVLTHVVGCLFFFGAGYRLVGFFQP